MKGDRIHQKQLCCQLLAITCYNMLYLITLLPSEKHSRLGGCVHKSLIYITPSFIAQLPPNAKASSHNFSYKCEAPRDPPCVARMFVMAILLQVPRGVGSLNEYNYLAMLWLPGLLMENNLAILAALFTGEFPTASPIG